MTRNQIEYWNLVETRRANAETQRSNLARESETARHNTATESVDLGKLAESTRHNVATEGQAGLELAEATRSHKASEKNTRVANREARRSHEASEFLQGRTIEMGAKTLAETKRSNKAKEALEFSKQAETQRANMAAERQRLNELAEQIRTHKANESISARNAQTQAFKQLADESFQKAQVQLKNAENLLKGEANATRLKELTNNMDKWKAELEEAKKKNDIDAALRVIDKVQAQEQISIDMVDTIWKGISGSVRAGADVANSRSKQNEKKKSSSGTTLGELEVKGLNNGKKKKK